MDITNIGLFLKSFNFKNYFRLKAQNSVETMFILKKIWLLILYKLNKQRKKVLGLAFWSQRP